MPNELRKAEEICSPNHGKWRQKRRRKASRDRDREQGDGLLSRAARRFGTDRTQRQEPREDRRVASSATEKYCGEATMRTGSRRGVARGSA